MTWNRISKTLLTDFWSKLRKYVSLLSPKIKKDKSQTFRERQATIKFLCFFYVSSSQANCIGAFKRLPTWGGQPKNQLWSRKREASRRRRSLVSEQTKLQDQVKVQHKSFTKIHLLVPSTKSKVFVFLLTEAVVLVYEGLEPTAAGRCKEPKREYYCQTINLYELAFSSVEAISQRYAVLHRCRIQFTGIEFQVSNGFSFFNWKLLLIQFILFLDLDNVSLFRSAEQKRPPNAGSCCCCSRTSLSVFTEIYLQMSVPKVKAFRYNG